MCDPATATAMSSFVISTASAVIGHQAEGQKAAQQNQYYQQNRAAANRAAVDNYASTQNRILQEEAASSQEQINLQKDAVEARATAQVAASAGGVSGLSVDALVADFYSDEGTFSRTLDRNLDMQSEYLRGEMDATEHKTTGRINSVQQASAPSFAGAAVRILGGAANAYSSYKRYS